MKENKSSAFLHVIFILIALCAVAITSLMVYQVTLGNNQIISLEAELDSCTNKLELQESALASAEEQLGQYEAQLGEYEEQLATYEKQIKDMLSEVEKKYAVSSTKEYAEWVAAQSTLEPYDLYYDLQYAYEQLVELDSDYLIGTEKYKAALNLLVPKKNQSDLESYMATLKRYFGTSDISTVRNRFIDDLVSAKLLTEEENNYYSWNKSTLTTKNVMSKLNLTEDVANALMGMLRTMDWDV